MRLRSAPAVLLLSMLLLPACGKGKAEAFAALDKHKDEYGRCEVIGEQKEFEGKPAWLGATVCRERA